jgi:hypothetical protein
MASLSAAHAALIPLYKPNAISSGELPAVETRGVSVEALRWLRDEAVARFGEAVHTAWTLAQCAAS